MFCSKCGAQLVSDATKCPYCGQDLTEETSAPPQQPVAYQSVSTAIPEFQKPENVALGFVGALIGALAGGLVIMLFGKMGYITSLGGLLLAFLTVFLYKKFAGGSIGKVGVIISLALVIITPYLAYRAGFAWEIAADRDPNLTMGLAFMGVDHTFGAIFAKFHYLVEITESNGDVIKDLLMLYLFTALGAVGTLVESLKGGKKKAKAPAEE